MIPPEPAGTPSPEKELAAGLRARWVGAALLALAVFLVYQPSWDAEFIWDDDAHLTEHKCIVGPLGFREIWTTPEAKYFPLVLTTFWVVNKIFGLDPVVFHVLGIALHAACAVVLWTVLRRLRVPGAFLGAAWWALHPVQVESVAWVSEIINTQSGLFFLLSIYCTLRWLEHPAQGAAGLRRDYLPALLFGAAALLSKPSTVGLPVVLGLCFWWKRGGFRMRDFRWLVPFFALALAVSLWAIWEQKVHQGAQGDEWDQTLAERAVIAGRVFWFYLAKLGWPDPLVFIYPRWAVAADQFGAYLPLLLALVLGAVVCVWRKTVSRGAYFALGFYVAMLFPVLGFFDIYFFRYSYVADHFQYLAGMAPLAFVAGAVQRVAAGGWRTRQRALFTGGSVLLLAALAQRSVTHARQFHDDTTLWTATLRHNPASFLAWNNLGTLSLEAGRFAEAEERFRRALALHPHLGQTHYNLGRTLNAMDRRNEALEHYLAAVRVDPQLEPAHLNLANALAGLPGREAEAVRHYAEALRLDPKNALTHTNLATVLGNLPGRLADAVAHAETAVRLDPQSPSAHLNLGVLLARIPERLSSAIAHFETALRLKPDYVKAHLNLGLALVAIPGRIEEGIRAYEAALRHEPRSATAHNNLGVARAQQQRWPEAIFHFEAATRIDPNFVEARENLSALRSAIANVPP